VTGGSRGDREDHGWQRRLLATIEAEFRAWYPQVKDPKVRLHTGKPVEKEIPKELFERGPSQ